MPGSWEIVATRQNRILVAVLMPPSQLVSMDFAQMLRTLNLPPGSDFMRVVGMPFGPGRNQAAKAALDGGYNLAFLDADMRCEPDAFLRLQQTGLDLVGGLYYQRFHPYLPCVFNMGRDQQGNIVKVPVTGWKPGDIFPAHFIPSGLTYHSHRFLQALFARFPRPWEWGVDTAPVPAEEGQVPPFSEDFTLSFRAVQMGFQPYMHSGVVGVHEVRAIVGPKWMFPIPDANPLNGVCTVA
jgi:hypothetical protein